MIDQITQASKILHQGGIVIFPTDTAFGIGCRMDNEAAVQKLFALRKRPETQAVSVLVSSITMAEEYLASIPDAVNQLLTNHWPGALTVILPARIEKVSSLILGGGKTLGVRQPNHQIPQELISAVGVPLLGPSANFHGEPTPYRYEDLNPELIKLVDYVIPGECPVGQASTVLDCSVTSWQVLRQGSVMINE